MTPFVRLSAIAAPIPLVNINTDVILPARYLTTVRREGLADGLFASLRASPSFILNRPPWDRAGILVALSNFGCGSSREHAPWALLDWGIRCVIAPSIAPIFQENCFKNGILPVILPDADVQRLLGTVENPSSAVLDVDLPTQAVTTVAGTVLGFDIAPFRKEDLLNGVDEIERTLEHERSIRLFEEALAHRAARLPALSQAGLDAAT